MVDGQAVEDLKTMLCDRYTPEELIEFLGVTSSQVFDRFVDECLEVDWEELR